MGHMSDQSRVVSKRCDVVPGHNCPQFIKRHVLFYFIIIIIFIIFINHWFKRGCQTGKLKRNNESTVCVLKPNIANRTPNEFKLLISEKHLSRFRYHDWSPQKADPCSGIKAFKWCDDYHERGFAFRKFSNSNSSVSLSAIIFLGQNTLQSWPPMPVVSM